MKKRCCLSAVKWLFTLTLKNYGSSTPVFVHVPGPLKYYIWSSLGFSMGKGARPPVRLWSHRRALTHSRECKSRRCPKCWWSQKGKRFRAFFPWLRFGRWLDAGSDSCFGFGCSACTQYAFAHSSGSSSTTARFALSTPSVSSRPLATPCRSERKAYVQRRFGKLCALYCFFELNEVVCIETTPRQSETSTSSTVSARKRH